MPVASNTIEYRALAGAVMAPAPAPCRAARRNTVREIVRQQFAQALDPLRPDLNTNVQSTIQAHSRSAPDPGQREGSFSGLSSTPASARRETPHS